MQVLGKTGQERFPRGIWLLSLLVLLLVGLIYFTGGSEVTEELVRQQLVQAYGVSKTQLERLSLRLPGGWQPTSWASLKSPPHDHPLPPKFSVLDTGVEMVIAHIGDGIVPGTNSSFQTTIELLEDNSFFNAEAVTGTVEFYHNDGDPLTLTLNGVTDSVFPFELKDGELLRLVSSGTGASKSGWAHVHATQPISAASSFGLRNAAGQILTDVGVEAATLASEFTIFADSIGESRTGLAVANPSDTETVNVNFELNDPSGAQVAARQRTLVPRGHLGIFLGELFQGVAGINEFEGSVLMTSVGGSAGASGKEPAQNTQQGPKFAALTLRSTGSQLTSVPAVTPPAEGSQRTKLAFPHVGDGIFGGLKVVTMAILFNNTSNPATGTIEFFNSNTTPMEVTIGGQTRSTFDFALNPKGVVRMATSGTGQGVGWARVAMDQPLSGSTIFRMFQAETPASSTGPLAAVGDLVTEVGVPAAALFQNLKLVVNTLGFFNTGVAIALPIVGSGQAGEEKVVSACLYGSDGSFVACRQVKVPLGGHRAQFVPGIFTDLQDSVDVNEFSGSLALAGSGQFMAPLALRSAGVKLTSTPSLPTRLNQFSPVSTVTFAQNLAGSSSGVKWLLHQNDNDFSLEKVKITAPKLGLNTDALGVGGQMAFGYLARGSNTRIFEFLVRKKGSLEFDTIITKSEGDFVQGTGLADGTPSGGLSIELTLLNKDPFTEVGDDADQEFFFPPGLIQAPASGGPVTVTTEFTSVSTRVDQDVRIVRRTTQELTFVEPDSQKANLEGIFPQFVRAGELMALQGSNLGDSPTVLFPGADQQEIQAQASRDEQGALTVYVPPKVGDGLIRIDNGSGAGNGYLARVLFGPTFETGLLSNSGGTTALNGGNAGFYFLFQQPAVQFVLEDFSAEMYHVDAPLAQLQLQSLVENGLMKQEFNSSSFNLKVSEASEDRAVLQAVTTFDPDQLVEKTIVVEKVKDEAGSVLGLIFTYTADDPEEEPMMLEPGSAHELRIEFTGLSISLPASGTTMVSVASMGSMPTDGTGTRFRVENASVFEIP